MNWLNIYKINDVEYNLYSMCSFKFPMFTRPLEVKKYEITCTLLPRHKAKETVVIILGNLINLLYDTFLIPTNAFRYFAEHCEIEKNDYDKINFCWKRNLI